MLPEAYNDYFRIIVANKKTDLPTKKIFICYRRDDSAGYAGRVYDALEIVIGSERLFRDINTINPGDNFPDVIKHTISTCAFLIVIIGENWLHSLNNPVRNGEHSVDFVRKEISAAFEMGIVVIPVLVQRTSMPNPTDLPEDLRPLAYIHALEISDSRWKYDIAQLVSVVAPDKTPDKNPVPRKEPIGVEIWNLTRKLIAITIIFISFLYFFFRIDIVHRLLFTNAPVSIQELFFPSFLLIIGVFILSYKIK